MADDKGGGGGSSWEPFEIIIVILLIVALLSRLSGGTPVTTQEQQTPKPKVVTTPKPDPAMCGLTIARPHTLERVANFVTLIGSTQGCNWPMGSDGVALYAQVIDARGMPVSAYTTVVPTTTDLPTVGGSTSVHFDTSIQFIDAPATATGYIILIPATNPSDQSLTIRIPIKF